jgi:hypothetical protein
MVWVGPPEALENEGFEKAEAVSAVPVDNISEFHVFNLSSGN